MSSESPGLAPDEAPLTTEIYVNVGPGETRAALLEGGALQELYIERASRRGLVGNLYKGRVSRVLPGMQAAFVELGLERTAFLHVAEIAPARPEDAAVTADGATVNPHGAGNAVGHRDVLLVDLRHGVGQSVLGATRPRSSDLMSVRASQGCGVRCSAWQRRDSATWADARWRLGRDETSAAFHARAPASADERFQLSTAASRTSALATDQAPAAAVAVAHDRYTTKPIASMTVADSASVTSESC